MKYLTLFLAVLLAACGPNPESDQQKAWQKEREQVAREFADKCRAHRGEPAWDGRQWECIK